MQETVQGMAGAISYNLALFEAATIRQMMSHYAKLLEAAAASPHLKISDLLQTLPEFERRVVSADLPRADMARRRAELAARRAKLPTAKAGLLKEWLQESQ
jgi:non-ribosomal peptide synthetase component F